MSISIYYNGDLCMEKIIYILLLIILEHDFYKDVNTLYYPTSYDYIVNKNNKLTSDFIPNDLEIVDDTFSLEGRMLRKKAKDAFLDMAKQAKKEGYNIILVSAFRTYEYQEELYNNYKLEKGKNYADMCSARAGHSEHQTGLAIDVSDNSLDYDNFESTKEFNWMINNAYKYGFILRYPKGKFHITGFKYEPWHFRYVGDIAKDIYESRLTLEEFFS